MKFTAIIFLIVFAVSCGKSNSSGGNKGRITRNPLASMPICQGPAQVNGPVGVWSDYLQGADDFVDINFENSGRLTLTLGCKTPNGDYYTDTTTTRYNANYDDISVNNHQNIEVQTGGQNCELENLGGNYTFHVQGQCLVLNNGTQQFYFARVE